jgi:putative hydrolase of the HAD superfamily
MRLPVLIFDFGNVVGFFDYLILCERFGRRLGLTAESFRDLALANGFTPLLLDFESGRIPPEDFATRIGSMTNLSIPYDEFVDDWSDIFRLNEPVSELIAGLRGAGYRLILGSNTNALHAPFYRRKFATTLDHFEHLVLSHEVGHMKPAREFYEACVSKADAPADSCVFIDDVLENVEGARAAGLQAIHYQDDRSLLGELEALGVEIGG